MKKDIKIEGQLDLFSLPLSDIQPQQPKKEVTKPVSKASDLDKIIEQYRDSCKRIVKHHRALLIGLEDKTLYYNQHGEYEFDLNADIGLMPADEIVVVNKDLEINEIQLKKLHEISPKSYVKRKGDVNIYLPKENSTEVITKDGWLIEWNQKLKYKEDELIIAMDPVPYEVKVADEEELNIGDLVSFMFKGQLCMGTIRRIYNKGETVNVDYLNKVIPFYYKSVTLIQKQSEMQQIQFTKDCTELNKEFIKDSIFNVYEEQEGNYIIFKDGVFYGTLKDNCRKVV